DLDICSAVGRFADLPCEIVEGGLRARAIRRTCCYRLSKGWVDLTRSFKDPTPERFGEDMVVGSRRCLHRTFLIGLIGRGTGTAFDAGPRTHCTQPLSRSPNRCR